MSRSFAHLHTHSSHSVRDSIAKPDEMFAAAAADSQAALAITDHGNLSGLYVAYRAAKEAGVPFIAGLEAYLAIEDGEPDARLRRATASKTSVDSDATEGEAGQTKYTHLTLLAENAIGLSNLMRLVAESNSGDAFWSKPRADLDVLESCREGLIVLSGCIGGPVKSRLAQGDVEGAYAATERLTEMLGRDNFFIEVMSHGIAEEDALNAELVRIARHFGLGMVATNDSHFTHAHQSLSHEAWLCGASSQTLSDPNHWKFSGEGFHLRSATEMRALFDDEPGFEEACDNTLVIAERATQYEMFPKHALRIPQFAPDDPRSASEILYERVREGAIGRYGSPLPVEVKERLRYELDTIGNAGLSDYFLIVADMIDRARARGIRVGPGRGSAAGSCVSYCLGIIGVDPLRHGLLFERFLNPTRNKMPDIDTDFEQGRRHEVVSDLIERWGHESVALIGTLGYSLSKNSLRVAGKVLSRAADGAKLADYVPTLGGGKTATIADLTKESFAPGADFRRAMESAKAHEVVEVASDFDGVVNTESIHPCGVVIGDEPLAGLIPLRSDRRAADKGGTGGWVSEFDGEALESLGYLKMDVLGLLTLDVIEAAVREIERRTGHRIDTDLIADDDGPEARAAWDLFAAGRTEGLFQVEGGGMQDLGRRLRPASVDDLAVVIALYRPGPLGIGMHDIYANRKNGAETMSYDMFTRRPEEVEVIASVLDETLGVIIYQEQLLRIAELVGGFNPPERDNLLRAISKKSREAMDRSGALFIELAQSDVGMDGNPKTVFAEETAQHLWEAMKSAGEYSFNKSHSVGYARLSFITAWLKANYPAEYAAGWLARADNQEKRLAFLASLRESGVVLRYPDVNSSHVDPHVVEDGVIQLGLGKIRDVSSVAADVVAEREAHGPFTSIVDLMNRVRTGGGARRISLTTLRGLIEAGACDAFGSRKGMIDSLEILRKKPDTPIPTDEWGLLDKSVRERVRLGILVGENPLTYFAPRIKEWTSPRTGRSPVPIHRIENSGSVTTVGVLSAFEIKKKKTRFATLTLSGTKGDISGVIWGSVLERLERAGRVPAVGAIVGVDANVQEKASYGPVSPEGDDGETPASPVRELVVNDLWWEDLEGLESDDAGETEDEEEGSGDTDEPDADSNDGETTTQSEAINIGGVDDDDPFAAPAPSAPRIQFDDDPFAEQSTSRRHTAVAVADDDWDQHAHVDTALTMEDLVVVDSSGGWWAF